jgi:hypothetical protein
MPVVAFEIRSREPFDGGRAFGDVGAYERIDGVLRYSVDPEHALNSAIVDLPLAARDENGRVSFEGDVALLQPVDPSRANGRLLCDIANRGTATFSRYDVAADEGYLLQRGWSVASIGWQWDVQRGAGLLGLDAPTALDSAGRPIQGSVSVTYQPGEAAPHFALADAGASYPVADMEQADAQFFIRDFPNGTRQLVARDRWRFTRGDGGATQIVFDRSVEPGRFYEVIYRTNTTPVVGCGLLAVRDAAHFFRYPNEVDNGVHAAITHALAAGFGQPGRFLREFVAAGMNIDYDKPAFDGMHIHAAGGIRGEFNYRFAQPSVREPYGLGHLPPYAYDDGANPFSRAAQPGLLARQRERGAVPKIIATNTSTEYWRGDASMLHITPDGAGDLPDAPETRTYLFASTQHDPGTLPLRTGESGERPVTSHPMNIVDYRPLLRAALANLEGWVVDGVVPPPSAVPRLADGTARTRDRAAYDLFAATGLDTIAPKRLWALPRLEFGPSAAEGIGTYPPLVSQTEMYPSFVSAVDADGNEVAGIRPPDVAVPLATHTGWNPRNTETGGLAETAGAYGSSVPFHPTAVERARFEDPRPAIEERYADRDDYLQRVRTAAEALVAERHLLREDLEVVVNNAAERWDALVSADVVAR